MLRYWEKVGINMIFYLFIYIFAGLALAPQERWFLGSLDPSKFQEQQQQQQQSSTAVTASRTQQEEVGSKEQESKPKKSVSFPGDSLDSQLAKIANSGKATAETKRSNALDRLASKARDAQNKKETPQNNPLKCQQFPRLQCGLIVEMHQSLKEQVTMPLRIR